MVDDPVQQLVAAGDYVAAARCAMARGEPRRAIQLLERVWRFADAIPIALELGDRPLAIRLALDARDLPGAVHISDDIARDDQACWRVAAEAFAARGHPWEAARAAERAHDATMAARHYRRAGAPLEAGRMEEAAGRLHEAGVAYEQAIALASDARDEAMARLALGRLLARLGRHHDAARELQRAVREPSQRGVATRALSAALLAMGYRIAAAEALARGRTRLPELPATPEEAAAMEAADAAAGTSAVGQVGAQPGLVRRRFHVLAALGAGSTSQVWKAEDTLLGLPVALKLLSLSAGGGGGGAADPRAAERQAYTRFAREAEAAGRLRHPNIVGLYDADPTSGLFVLELMPGGTLADRLATGRPLSPALVRRLALDLLSALAASHEQGIVHRDVKPANIFFDAAGNAKLGDFGVAHLADFGQTQTGGLLGTVAYMAPEQISGGAIGLAADLYALGVTLFQALTGRLPFLGPDIVAQHLGESCPIPSRILARLNRDHDRVVVRALEKAPEDRWRSAAEMAVAIRAWPTREDAVGTDGAAARTGGPGGTAADLHATGNEAPSDGDGARHADPTEGVTGGDARAGLATDSEIVVGQTVAGRLLRRQDPRLGRTILLERRATPLRPTELVALRILARAAGPHVQRVLALSEDQREITYEALQGAVIGAADLRGEPAARLAALRAELTAAGVPEEEQPHQAVLTDTGVTLVVAPVPVAFPSPD